MEKLIETLSSQFPKLRLTPGDTFSWSPETGEIIYRAGAKGKGATWSLLHETGHALLEHTAYQADFELIRLEVAAWEKAKELADDIGIEIDENHIQDCLDTYRDWLYKRSICPGCGTKCLQQDDFVHYRCHNCHAAWRVTASRFCRAYRRSKDVPQPATLHL